MFIMSRILTKIELPGHPPFEPINRMNSHIPMVSLRMDSRDLADSTWIVYYDNDTSPPAYYVYNRKTGKLDFLFSTRPALDKYQLAEVHPMEIESRDGLTLHCYLTFHPGVEPKTFRCCSMCMEVHGTGIPGAMILSLSGWQTAVMHVSVSTSEVRPGSEKPS